MKLIAMVILALMVTNNIYLPVIDNQSVNGSVPKATATITPSPTATLMPTETATPDRSACEPSYPTICVPPPPPDLSCADIFPLQDFPVTPPDPHGFDRDRDGIGCESGG